MFVEYIFCKIYDVGGKVNYFWKVSFLFDIDVGEGVIL